MTMFRYFCKCVQWIPIKYNEHTREGRKLLKPGQTNRCHLAMEANFAIQKGNRVVIIHEGPLK